MSIPPSPQLAASVGRSGVLPTHLLEVEDVNGNLYFWADRKTNVKLPSVFTGQVEQFVDWLLAVPQITFYRSLTAASGEFIVQNVSGDTLARDVDKLLRASALEGALFIYRMWQAESQDSWLEWRGTLKVASVDEEELHLTCKDLFDPNEVPTHERQYSECCPWLWGSKRCGVTVVAPGLVTLIAPVRYVAAPIPTPLPVVSSSTRPNYVPINPIGTPPGSPPSSGPPGSPGNPGTPGTPGTVNSSVECNYSFETCQVPERFGGVLNHYEPNEGEALTRMVAPTQTRLRKA